LNLYGICGNSACEAYKKEVVIKIGYGRYKYGENADKNRCPMCKKLVNELTGPIGFRNCYYSFIGKILEND